MKGFLAFGISLAVFGVRMTAIEAATINIDRFTQPTPDPTGVAVSLDQLGVDFSQLQQVGLSDVLGNSRYISLQYESGPIDTIAQSGVFPNPPGLLRIENGTFSEAVVTTTLVRWDRNGSGLGDLNLDSLDMGEFVINLTGSLNTTTTFTVIVETQGMGTTQASVTIPGGQVPFSPVSFPFTSFTQPNLLNNPFQSISLDITGDAGFAVDIDEIFIEGDPIVNPSVPEPFLGMGLLGVACLGIGTRLGKK
jgi:hypothetical protein